MRFVAIKQMTVLLALRRYRTASGSLFQAEDCLLKPDVPLDGCFVSLRADPFIQIGKVAQGAFRQANEVCHDWPGMPLMLRGPGAYVRSLHLPAPGGYLPLHPIVRQGRAR